MLIIFLAHNTRFMAFYELGLPERFLYLFATRYDSHFNQEIIRRSVMRFSATGLLGCILFLIFTLYCRAG